MNNEKILPIVPGCKAMITGGQKEDVGKIVDVHCKFTQSNDPYVVEGITFYWHKINAGRWHVTGDNLTTRDDKGENAQTGEHHAVVLEKFLLRIDGGKEDFTCSDAFVYTNRV